MGYRVIAPLVYLKVPDQSGAYVNSTFYAGAVVPEGIHPDSLQHHLDNGQVVDDGDPVADVLGVPAGTPVPGEPPNVPVSEGGPKPLEERAADVRKAAEAVAKRASRSKSE